MEYSYCTLFDKNYLDKGLLTVKSLHNVSPNARIYVLAMDDMCYDVMSSFDYIHAIKLEEFMDEELKTVKSSRSRAEFCWTCTASLIIYVLKNFSEDVCTYIDADMYFFKNPNILVDEMLKNQKEVQIIEHRITQDFMGKLMLRNSGRFCVEFNTFVNSENSLNVLLDWRKKTIEHCSSDSTDGKPKGDQSYLEAWPEQFSCVDILQNVGAGIAPWNIDRYRIVSDDDEVCVSFDGMGKYDVYFYHYHNLQYINRHMVDINVFKNRKHVDKKTVNFFYYRYLLELEVQKKWVCEKYGFIPLIKEHPGILKNIKKPVDYYAKRVFSKQLFVSLRSRLETKFLKLACGDNDIIVF